MCVLLEQTAYGVMVTRFRFSKMVHEIFSFSLIFRRHYFSLGRKCRAWLVFWSFVHLHDVDVGHIRIVIQQEVVFMLVFIHSNWPNYSIAISLVSVRFFLYCLRCLPWARCPIPVNSCGQHNSHAMTMHFHKFSAHSFSIIYLCAIAYLSCVCYFNFIQRIYRTNQTTKSSAVFMVYDTKWDNVNFFSFG